jgi:hypothetical protein
MVDPSELKQLFRYDAETGKLYWLERPVTSHYVTTWNARFAGQEAFSVSGQGYKEGKIHGSRYSAHRVIWAMVHGYWPEMIDHINGDRADNRIENLRAVSNMENQRNAKLQINSTSGIAGVTWRKERNSWRAFIYNQGRMIDLGRFANFDDAVTARKVAEQQIGFHPNHGRTAP